MDQVTLQKCNFRVARVPWSLQLGV